MLSFPTGAQGEKKKGGGGVFSWWRAKSIAFHFSTSPAALIQFRAYDCNTKTERLVKPETAMMNAPLLRVLVCFGVAWRGGGGGGGGGGVGVVGGIEFYAYLLRCIFLTAAALLYPRRQH